jgi:hypothetical protein
MKQRHATLMYKMLENINSVKPKTRRPKGAPPSQALAECVIDRPGQRQFSNIDSDKMTFTHGSYSSDRRTLKIGGKDILQELIKIKKELDWWKSCNQRLFISQHGKFFRDDKRLYLWRRQFKKRKQL